MGRSLADVERDVRALSERERAQLLRACERKVYRVKNLPPDLAKTIKASRMDSRHRHLDSLLDDE